MSNNYHKILIAILLTVKFTILSSQSLDVGGGIGIGQSTFNYSSNSFRILNYTYESKTRFQVNSLISYTLDSAKFCISSGLSYIQQGSYFSDLDYLTLPVSAKFIFGKTLKFYFGGGFYCSVLIRNSDQSFSQEYNDFDIGGIICVGLRYTISPRLKIDLEYVNMIGQRAAYINERGNGHNNLSHFIRIGLLTDVLAKKNSKS